MYIHMPYKKYYKKKMYKKKYTYGKRKRFAKKRFVRYNKKSVTMVKTLT